MATTTSDVSYLSTGAIERNPFNPRRFFNEERLDDLRTSIQEVGILVPLIVYEDPERRARYILLDGERRWISAIDLGLESVPANIIPAPSSLENILRMFNIHAVREEWPLISVALSLQQVMQQSGEDRERRLAELTGLKPGTVRRARRILNLPLSEIAKIREEAHLPRSDQVHREDLYLEVDSAVASIGKYLPEVVEEYGRDKIIRNLVRKRERKKLRAITDFRGIPQLLQAMARGEVTERRAANGIRRMIERVEVNPLDEADAVAQGAFERAALGRRVDALLQAMETIDEVDPEVGDLADRLQQLRREIDRLLRR